MSKTQQPDLDIEKGYSNPFNDGTFLHDIFGKVLSENRDIIILVTDHRARRGTGKTVASLSLASKLDQTDDGMSYEKCSLSPEEIRNAYTEQPPQSALLLDEIEQAASNRETMTVTNRALREIMSMGRVEQKYVVANAPVKGFIDLDVLKLTDVWISMTRRGRGLAHYLKWEPYLERLLTEKKQWLEFEDIEQGTDLRGVYNKLTEEKRDRMDGGGDKQFVRHQEHEKEIEQVEKKTKKEARDEFVKSIYEHPESDVTQKTLGDAVGLAQETVSKIIN